jgi:sorbitol-specific phosphotransferase system component IIC
MEILVVIAVIFFFLVVYVNIKVTRDIARSAESTSNERVLSYFVVWLIPLLGVFFISRKVLPGFHRRSDGGSLLGGDGGSDGGCSGGDCG